ncbi:hypothetical protein HAX54_006987 [Datura stramonium]|uniref:Hexosyltransferase n=1 Tax=Datura stramonium TaxID=4076 RepID=A0ABS8TBU7_DATST|nr:hypothetical protein [Datura stramonium]
MPSNPKIFTARPSYSYYYHSRRSVILIYVLLWSFNRFIFGFIAISRRGLGYSCKYAEPRSVSVAWDRTTGFGSVARRQSLRRTWFPSDHNGLQKLEEATGLAFRFVIGRTSDKSKMSALKKEVSFCLWSTAHQDALQQLFSRLPMHFMIHRIPHVKADDDICYGQNYCVLIFSIVSLNLYNYYRYEPLSSILGKEYFLHAYGPIYALSADVVASLVALRNNSFRMFSNEDVTVEPGCLQ